MENYLTYENYQVHYQTFGSGKKALLTFPGYGQEASDFKTFESALGNSYQLIVINLFYHANSKLLDGNVRPISKIVFSSLVEKILNTTGVLTCDIMGYSMGGRLALCLIEQMPEKINEAFLLAPDGISVTSWYQFVTSNPLGRRAYRYLIKKPKIFFLGSSWLNRLRLLNDRTLKFLYIHMKTQEQRQKVLDTWITYKELTPDLGSVVKNLRNHHIKTHLIYGKYDPIIPPRQGHKLQQMEPELISLHIADGGHQLINQKTSKLLKKLIQNNP